MCFFSILPANSCWKGKKLNLEIGLQERSNIVRCVSVSRISFWLMRQSIEPICIMNMYYIQQSKNIAIAFKWAISFFVISLYFFFLILNQFRCSLFNFATYTVCTVQKKNENNIVEMLNMKRAAIVYFHTNSLFFTIIISRSRIDSCFVPAALFLQSIWIDREEKKRIESAYMSLCVDSHEFQSLRAANYTPNNIKSTYAKIAKVVKTKERE